MSRAVRVVAGLLVCLLAVAGCSTLAALQDLSSEVKAAGYENVNINHQSTNGHSVLTIEAMRTETLSGKDADKIAEIAWSTYAADFDELQVVLNGQVVLTAGADELAAQFGERPAGLGEESSSDGVNVTALVVILACAAVVAVILVLLWRRGNRRPPAPNQPYPPQSRFPYSPPPQ
jgi:hypothetical protein